jgi:AraC family transcriptional activator of pobA
MARHEISFDRLAGTAEPIQVWTVESMSIGPDGDAPREPHRHDYHELLWTRAGTGSHLLDGREIPVQPGTIMLIGRGQVHIFDHAEDVSGTVVRFGEDLLHSAPSERPSPAWLFTGLGGHTIEVPHDEVDSLEQALALLEHEVNQRADRCSADLIRHLLSVLLLWAERWYDVSRAGCPDPNDSAVALHRRFTEVLEHEFARHHEAAWYADALAVPPKALSHALTELTGRSTKDLILDRVMVEAARLLRFTDLTIGQVAAQTGFDDQLYFSRAFSRHHGVSPSAFRERARGRSEAPAKSP